MYGNDELNSTETMSFFADHTAIESRFETLWVDGSEARTPVAYENVDFKPKAEESFVRLTIIDGESRQASLEDSPLHRRIGIIVIQIFTRPGLGTQPAEALADYAAIIFRSVQFSGITCRSPEYRKIGEVEDWYQINVEVPFYVDEQF